MKALITGASSGIGRSMAKYLADLGYDLILVARRTDRLEKLKKELSVNVLIYSYDLTDTKNVYELYEKVKKENVDFVINNAGFGLFGMFDKTDLETELNMIDLNVKAPHILTKLFLKDFKKRNKGYILNVCSSAGFMAGPMLSTYYATKNYITKLTMAINEELRINHSNVHIAALCPGPVETEFNKVAKGKFTMQGIDADYVAQYAINKALKGKMLIVPTIGMKLGLFFTRLLPYRAQLKIVYNIQNNKINKD